MPRYRLLLRLFVRLAISIAGPAFAAPLAFQVPPGFEVTHFAGNDMVNNCFSMTIDAKGRPVVSGPGYIKILHDDNGDGVADRFTVYSTLPKSGAQGMYFDGTDLIATGDFSLLRFHDANGDDKADGPPEVLRANIGEEIEHSVHGVAKGPDGWIYVMGGNRAKLEAFGKLSSASAVATPQNGTLFRLSPDFLVNTVVAHGLRNSYDFDFAATGQMLTFDADGERVFHLPGYAPTRIYDLAVGEHHGWMLPGSKRSWSRPPYLFDNVERAFEVGRGSPTGVTVYRHRQFPLRYRDGVFAACWSLGVIYFFPLTPHGSTFDATLEKFALPTGNEGFAPVDLVVSPQGDLFVAIGGRGTHGGVFRIHYTGTPQPAPNVASDVDRVLVADQPLSSWSRVAWVPLARRLGMAAFENAAADEARPMTERVRAIEVLTEVFGGLRPALAPQLAATREPRVAARVAWALAAGDGGVAAIKTLVELSKSNNPIVQRAAWEAFRSLPPAVAGPASPDWAGGAASPDRRVRAAAIATARRSGVADTVLAGENIKLVLARLRLAVPEGKDPGKSEAFFRNVTEIYRTKTDATVRLEAVRLLQLGMGDMQVEDVKDECDTGYAPLGPDNAGPALRTEMARTVADGFPAHMPALDAEIARLLGMLRADAALALPLIAQLWTAESLPEDDLHFLLTAVQLSGARPADSVKQMAHAYASLHRKMTARKWLADRPWPQRVSESFQRSARLAPSLAAELVADPGFGRADHSLFVPLLDGETKLAAARKLFRVAQTVPGATAWTPELVEAVGLTLPPAEVLPALRAKFAEPRVRDAVAAVLAVRAEPADRARLVQTLGATGQATLVENTAKALLRTPGRGTPEEMAAAIKALGRHASNKPATLALHTLLQAWSGVALKIEQADGRVTAFRSWQDWFASAHPAEAKGLAAYGAVNTPVWLKRLVTVDWTKGDAARGATVYQQRACAVCHEGTRKVGPDLTSIGTRFNREDLFANIVDPNLSISPAYQAIEITLRDGTTYTGMPVYQSPDATILELAPDSTIRLNGSQIARTEPARRSLMPEGLLTGLTDADLADLYSYLQSK